MGNWTVKGSVTILLTNDNTYTK